MYTSEIVLFAILPSKHKSHEQRSVYVVGGKKVKLIAFNVDSNSYSYFIARFILFVLKFRMMCSSFVHVWWISDNLRALWHQCAFLFQKLAFFFICLAFRSIHLFMRMNRSQIIEPIRVLHLNKYWMKHRKIPFKMNAWSHYS